MYVQMEEVMSHSFRPSTIRDMELTLLKALQWSLACVTPFSFLQLLLPLITSCTTAATASRCTRLLIRSLSGTARRNSSISIFLFPLSQLVLEKISTRSQLSETEYFSFSALLINNSG
jgi:hypothetical protein